MLPALPRGGSLPVAIRRAALALALVAPAPLAAQQAVARPDTIAAARQAPPVRPPHYWRSVAAGFAASLLAHESAHVLTAVALGAHPSFGLNMGRPTIYSGIDAMRDPHKQFLFSSMGLNVQTALDEGILDVPHDRGAPFERGVLLGGIATTLFYVTIGRTASVSDVDFMARTSSLTKTDITILYGGVALLHVARIHRDDHYANFFLRPAEMRGLKIGVHVD